MQLIPRAPQSIFKTAVAKYLQLELCPNQPLQILLNSTMSHANNLNASIEKMLNLRDLKNFRCGFISFHTGNLIPLSAWHLIIQKALNILSRYFKPKLQPVKQ